MAEDWYVQQADGTVVGPLPEKVVAADLLEGKIDDAQHVRQGVEAEWCEAHRARAVFRRLHETGWFIKDGEEVFGPFTDQRVLELHRANDIRAGAQLRQGQEGIWRPAATLLASWQQQKVAPSLEESSSFDVGKWSIAPIRHVSMKLSEASESTCQPYERLMLREVSSDHFVVERKSGETIGSLSLEDVKQVQFNVERGVMHLAFLSTSVGPREINVVFCPPGVDAHACRSYIEEHFPPPPITS